jgi:hypothetical protein
MKNDQPQHLVVGLFLKYVGFEIDVTVEKGWGILLMPLQQPCRYQPRQFPRMFENNHNCCKLIISVQYFLFIIISHSNGLSCLCRI